MNPIRISLTIGLAQLFRGQYTGDCADPRYRYYHGTKSMGFGHLTKQLASEAIADALSSDKPDKPTTAPESPGAGIVKQVQAMQAALKEGEELVVLFHNGIEPLRVLDFFQPSSQLVVMTGLDDARNVTRVILPGDKLQLTCKVMKVQSGTAPVRVRFITTK